MMMTCMTGTDDEAPSYKILYEAQQKLYAELAADRAELVEKYNAVVADRAAILRTVRLLPAKMLAGVLADLQAIVADAPRFEPGAEKNS
jgi:hypothetical protein